MNRHRTLHSGFSLLPRRAPLRVVAASLLVAVALTTPGCAPKQGDASASGTATMAPPADSSSRASSTAPAATGAASQPLPSSRASTPAPPAASPTARADAAAGSTAGRRRIESNDGSYVVLYSVRPAPIPTNEPFEIDVTILDARRDQALVRDADLAVDAAMPHHRHGMNVVPVVRGTNGGGFVTRGMLFHMPGRWEIYFDITRRGVTERAQDVVWVD